MCRSNGHRSPIQSLDHIAELAQTLAPLLEDEVDAGARKSQGLEFVGRRKDSTTRTRPAPRRSIRGFVALILRAEDELVEAGAVIANGYLRLDQEEWIRMVEKRPAALQGR